MPAIELPEENPEVFALFADWLYIGGLALRLRADDADMLLVELYLFAKRRVVPECANIAITLLDEVWHPPRSPSSVTLVLASSETSSTSKLRRLIVDKSVWKGELLDLEKMMEPGGAIHPYMSTDLCRAVLRRLGKENHVLTPKCSENETLHVCEQCRSRIAIQHAVARTFTIPPSGGAPTRKAFCATYHDHENEEERKMCPEAGEVEVPPPPPPAGDKTPSPKDMYRARYDYTHAGPGAGLSFQKGELFVFANKQNADGWLYVRRHSGTDLGWVQQQYVVALWDERSSEVAWAGLIILVIVLAVLHFCWFLSWLSSDR